VEQKGSNSEIISASGRKQIEMWDDRPNNREEVMKARTERSVKSWKERKLEN
jgi:hypothetical protein